ncbi:hypothetical protein MUN81_22555 (plasmid) [Hymenobacter sp. 5317J-9]|uniref:hypothetical protein n=1 Tax=Hymenobacter sp. 5317J-9 TaxID=2932250 RepID=UPI001FD6C28C|nr:hypothetical protein [Hymenobacter sp. 5317J-9]UOR00225.1 hypothetical protein MUN81_22555 [Hymenobacter sp. 5317J-9]
MAYTSRTASAEVLTSLAILKVQVGQGQDFLQNFIPFVAECVRADPSGVVTVPAIQAGFKKLFGFNVPAGVVLNLLRRATKQGYLTLDNRVYRPVRAALDTLTIEHDREQAGQELDSLALEFQQFALEAYEHHLTLSEAEDALFGFITEHGVFSLLDGAARNELSAKQNASGHFLVGAFLTKLIDADSEQLKYFERAVQGSMLASVLHFEDKVNVSATWQNASVYFDTPILLRVIGLYGEEAKAPYLELIDLLKKQNVGLHCFQPTLSEIDRVLGYIQENLRQGRRELTVFEDLGEGLLSLNWTAGDVQTERGRVERKLLALGITPHELPRSQAHLTPNMTRVDDIFQQTVGYRNDNARVHDIEAVLAIHRLRNGLRPTQIERSAAIFVTNNFKVVSATREAFKECFGYRGEDVNACTSAEILTTIAWLKSSAKLGVKGSLPRKQLLADAYAAMKPSSEVWSAYLAELQKLRQDDLVTDEDVLYLRCAPEAVSALARVTLNEPTAFVEGTVEQVLDMARAANRYEAEQAQQAAAEALATAEEERAKLAREHQSTVEANQQQQQNISHLAALSQQQQQELQSKDKAVMELNAQLAAATAHVAGRTLIAQRVTKVLRVVFFVPLLFGLIYLAWLYTIKPAVSPEFLQAWARKDFFHSPVLVLVTLTIATLVGALLSAVDYTQRAFMPVERLLIRMLGGQA